MKETLNPKNQEEKEQTPEPEEASRRLREAIKRRLDESYKRRVPHVSMETDKPWKRRRS